jgi:hypothetical protein
MSTDLFTILELECYEPDGISLDNPFSDVQSTRCRRRTYCFNRRRLGISQVYEKTYTDTSYTVSHLARSRFHADALYGKRPPTTLIMYNGHEHLI